MMENEQMVRLRIRTFIEDNMNALFEDGVLQDSDNIFEKGFVTSIFAMQLLNFIEKEFDIEVSDEDILISNFSSVDNMMGLIERLRGKSHAN